MNSPGGSCVPILPFLNPMPPPAEQVKLPLPYPHFPSCPPPPSGSVPIYLTPYATYGPIDIHHSISLCISFNIDRPTFHQSSTSTTDIFLSTLVILINHLRPLITTATGLFTLTEQWSCNRGFDQRMHPQHSPQWEWG